MSRARFISIAFCTIALALGLAGVSHAGEKAAQEAARKAQDKHGGRVLKVERRDDGYRVKLLKDSGKVKVVFVPSPETRKKNKKAKKTKKSKEEKARNLSGEAPRRRLSHFGQHPVRGAR